MVVAAALAGVLGVMVAAWMFQGGVVGDTALVDQSPAPLPTPTPTNPSERTVYDFAPLVATSCLADATGDERAAALASMPASFNDELEEIAATVAAMRDVDFRRPVKTVLTPPREISRLVSRHVKDGPKARIEERILKLLGAVPRSMDLTSTVREAVGKDVLGFYKPGSRTIYSPRIVGNDPLGEVTVAHELEHALMDQQTGLPLKGRTPALEADAALAARALIEGDASLITQDYIFFGLDSEGRVKLGSDPTVVAAGDTDLPYFLERAFAFPYNEGLLFACYLYDKGGWSAIDDAYRDPPRSTAEILFPDRYGTSDPPIDVPDPRVADGWKRVARMSVGATDLLWLFEAPYGRPGEAVASLERVRVWNGGEIHAFERGTGFGFVMSLAGMLARDPALGPGFMCAETSTWLRDSWGASERKGTIDIWHQPDGNVVLMHCASFGPRIAFASDLGSARELLGRAKPRRL